MDTFDLIAILKYENYTPSEIVKMLNNINKYTLEEYAVENMTCPKCYSELVIHNWIEDRGEQFGFPSHEIMSKLICERCNWSIDE